MSLKPAEHEVGRLTVVPVVHHDTHIEKCWRFGNLVGAET